MLRLRAKNRVTSQRPAQVREESSPCIQAAFSPFHSQDTAAYYPSCLLPQVQEEAGLELLSDEQLGLMRVDFDPLTRA